MEPLIDKLEWVVVMVAGAFLTGIAFRAGLLLFNLAERTFSGRRLTDASAPDPATDGSGGARPGHVDRPPTPFDAPPFNLPAGPKRRIVRFGELEVNLPARELRRNGVRVPIQRQPFALLEALLEAPGEVVSREELRSRLWSSEENVEFDLSINTAVRKVRLALRDSATDPRFVETIPQLGYRFVAPLRSVSETAGHPTASRRGGAALIGALIRRRRHSLQ